MNMFELWSVAVVLGVAVLILFQGCKRPGWKDLLALRLVLCSYLMLLIQGAISGAAGGGTWNAETVVFLLSLITWLWGGVRALVWRSSRHRALTITCWAVYLLLGGLGAVA